MPFRFEKTSLAKGTDGGKLLNLLDDSCLRRGLKLRIHGKREDFRSDFFGDREVTFLETKSFIGLLQMKRNRDSECRCRSSRPRGVSVNPSRSAHAHHVEMMDRARP